jgi:hypothetical protein
MRSEGRVPAQLRVGITGHRVLQSPDEVRRKIRYALSTMCARLSDDDRPAAVTIVSALAEGADRLAVHVALETPRTRLEVVLPLEPADYEKDFHGAESIAEFRKLCERGSARVVSTAERPFAYRDAGRAVVDNVDVMLAVVDQDAGDNIGGTVDTVSYARNRGVPVVLIDPAGEDHPEVPALKTESSTFNAMKVSPTKFQKHLQANYEILLGGDTNDRDLAAIGEWIVGPFTRADLLALRFQSYYYRLGAAIFSLAALAVCAGIGQLIFFSDEPTWLWLEVACIVAGLCCYLTGSKLQVSDRWLTYRSLAERFRTSVYLARAAIGEYPEPVRERSGREVIAEGWVVETARDVWRARPNVVVDESDVPILRALLAEQWMSGQIRYHQGAERKQRRRERQIHGLTLVAVLFALVVGVLHASHLVGHGDLGDLLSLAGFAVPLAAAALNGIAEQREYGRHAERYERMVQNLQVVRRRMECTNDLDGLRRLTLLADAAIREEHGDWFGTMVFKHLEIAP